MTRRNTPSSKRRLGETLVRMGHITAEQLDEALEAQRSNGFRLGTNLLIKGYLGEEQLAKFLSEQMGLPAVDHIDAVPDAVRRRVPADLAQLRVVFPLGISRDELVLAMADPSDQEAIREVEATAKCKVRAVVAPELVVTHAIWHQYRITPDPQTLDLLMTGDLGLSVSEHETFEMDVTA